MSSIIEKIEKRRFYPVMLSDGTTRHVMPLIGWDKTAMAELKSSDAQLAFAIGRCLVNQNGSRQFDRGGNETPGDFAARVRGLTEDLTFADITELVSAINKVTKTPSVETIEKNSEPTATAAS